jgi:hypothetical protein
MSPESRKEQECALGKHGAAALMLGELGGCGPQKCWV